jgi:MraZ protein
VENCGKKGRKVGILDSPNFRGRSAARLDAKGRLRIPAKFREVLQKHYTDALFISQYGECLVAYPPEKWDEMEAKALNLSQIHPDHRSFVRHVISPRRNASLTVRDEYLYLRFFVKMLTWTRR